MASSCLSHVLEIEKLEITPKPNWLELPRDITINILKRLSTLEIVTSASVVCPFWWNICKDPLMWSTIDMMSNVSLSHTDFAYTSRLERICRYAVDRSCGHLKNIYIYKFGNNDLLYTIAKRASHLRCIRLNECHEITTDVFCEVLKMLPFLEELEIYYCYRLRSVFFEYIGEHCRHWKSLKYYLIFKHGDKKCNFVAFVIGQTMSELRHLAIFNNELSNDGLLAILDGCPLLESLDLRGCFHLDLDGSLGKRCKKQIKELRLPTDSANLDFDLSDYFISLQLRTMPNLVSWNEQLYKWF